MVSDILGNLFRIPENYAESYNEGVPKRVMVDYTKLGEALKPGFEKNNYTVKSSPMQGDDFRLLLTLNGSTQPSIEIYKEKNSQFLHYSANIKMGQKSLKKFNLMSIPKQQELRKSLEDLHKTLKLDFYEIEDDGKDYHVSIGCITNLDEFTIESVAESMDNLNESGKEILNTLHNFFS